MDVGRKDRIIASLLSGNSAVRISSSIYILKNPTPEQRLYSQLVYDSVIEKYKFDGLLRDEDTFHLLVGHGFLKPDFEKNLKELQDSLDNKKVELFKSALSGKKEQDKIRKVIKLLRDKIDEQLDIRHSFDFFTLNGIALLSKIKYITKETIHNHIGERILNPDIRLIEAVTRHRNIEEPSITELREIARTEPWLSYWKVGGFKTLGSAEGLSSIQKNILIISKMYENAYSYSEPPSDEVINDDDMFDGWMIEERRKLEENRKENTVKAGLGQQSNHKEVYLPVTEDRESVKVYHGEVHVSQSDQTEQDVLERASEIDSLNDFQSKLVKKQRAVQIAQQGTVKELDLADVRQEYEIARSKALSQAVKGMKNG